MYKLKVYISDHFEQVLVLSVLIIILFTHYFIQQKLAFLNVYYLPVLIAGFFLGRRVTVLFSVFCILLVGIFFLSVPHFITKMEADLDTILSIVLWGSFLILTSYVVGTLAEDKEEKIKDLKNAYIGVLEILSKYLESTDRYTKGHSIRVANLSTEIAIAMELSRAEVENVKAAALLHDIGKVEVSMDLIQKAASLDKDEKKMVDAHSEKGARILKSVGGVLKEAVPIVMAHHEMYSDLWGNNDLSLTDGAKMGASIIAVADTYDAITSDRPYRAGKTPLQAIEEIEKCSGRQFHPKVVEAFKRVLAVKVDNFENNVLAVA